MNAVQIAGNISPVLLGSLVRRGAPLRAALSLAVPAAYATCAVLFYAAGRARRTEAEAGPGGA